MYPSILYGCSMGSLPPDTQSATLMLSQGLSKLSPFHCSTLLNFLLPNETNDLTHAPYHAGGLKGIQRPKKEANQRYTAEGNLPWQWP